MIYMRLDLCNHVQFVNISGFTAKFKEMAINICLGYSFISIINSGEFDFETIIILRKDIKILNAAGPAFYAVTLHQIPPSPPLLVSEEKS